MRSASSLDHSRQLQGMYRISPSPQGKERKGAAVEPFCLSSNILMWERLLRLASLAEILPPTCRPLHPGRLWSSRSPLPDCTGIVGDDYVGEPRTQQPRQVIHLAGSELRWSTRPDSNWRSPSPAAPTNHSLIARDSPSSWHALKRKGNGGFHSRCQNPKNPPR